MRWLCCGNEGVGMAGPGGPAQTRASAPHPTIDFQRSAERRGQVEDLPSHLLPVAFYKDVAVFAMLPAMVHPHGVLVRRRNPYARRPDVRVSVPAMIALLVNPSGVRRRAAFLHHCNRGADLHDDFRAHRPDCQDASGYRSHYQFSHVSSPFRGKSIEVRSCFEKLSAV